MTRTLTGGCQCGRVRYTATVEPEKAYLCHCDMCKRATGGVSIAFIAPPRENVAWHAERDWYQSSGIARRGFCARCGTPLAFEFLSAPKYIDLTIGSFDDPTPFAPEHNHAAERMLPAWIDIGGLPAMRSDENEGLARRWREAGLAPPV